MTTCDSLLTRLGFSCRLVGDETIDVSTPFAFADGEPIGFYLEEKGLNVHLNDNANTLAHLGAIGYDISDRKKWRSVKLAVEAFGFEMSDYGQILGNSPIKAQHLLVTRYISAMMAVVDWEREYLGLSEDVDQFVQEVEMYLRAWKPDARLDYFPMVTGHSGRMHRFHFDFDGSLIDAARPHGTRTGSILRKAADVINTGEQRKILVIMDDRGDLERAKIETDILSTMVSVMPFTRLIANVSGGAAQEPN